MTIIIPERYVEMLDATRRGGYAYPAINVTSSQTLNAALKGFADARFDGTIQISVGGAVHVPGIGVNDRITSSLALAAFAYEVAAKYPNITIVLYTDHCARQYLDEWVHPLLVHKVDQVVRGQEPILWSHMRDGSTVPPKENLDIVEELFDKSQKVYTVLEIEIGTVGGEEDGHSAEINEKLYSIPEDDLEVVRRLGLGERGRYMAAFTFGNVHSAYKPGVIKLRPSLLGDIQTRAARAVAEGELPGATGMAYFPNGKPFELAFHGGSGSRPGEIAEVTSYGVIKMNIDTDAQYAFTRPIADYVFENYDKVLKINGEVGEKRSYDPHSWGCKAEDSISARMVEACRQLGSVGKALK